MDFWASLEHKINYKFEGKAPVFYVIKDRRAGDIATCYADASKAEKELGWKAEYGIREMCEDFPRWYRSYERR